MLFIICSYNLLYQYLFTFHLYRTITTMTTFKIMSLLLLFSTFVNMHMHLFVISSSCALLSLAATTVVALFAKQYYHLYWMSVVRWQKIYTVFFYFFCLFYSAFCIFLLVLCRYHNLGAADQPAHLFRFIQQFTTQVSALLAIQSPKIIMTGQK
jgi:hypothetical protein